MGYLHCMIHRREHLIYKEVDGVVYNRAIDVEEAGRWFGWMEDLTSGGALVAKDYIPKEQFEDGTKLESLRPGPHPLYADVKEYAARLAKGNQTLEKHMTGHETAWDSMLFLELYRSVALTSSDKDVVCFCAK